MRIRFQIRGIPPVGYTSFRKGAPSRKFAFVFLRGRLRAAMPAGMASSWLAAGDRFWSPFKCTQCTLNLMR
jgi:hypothetical protein